ncbi:Hpt domain-containing protein [Cognatishimia activa]|uniref:Hpt domain-containing protein n=1 Tax=Cognatishimia activa TaxID=1715691 RepID=UPI00223145FA|nr:Hpt domain-containing protein [Cognatishimia activa]UZD90694.1 Hpt domain-containing protein [Cognatishimia activa]
MLDWTHINMLREEVDDDSFNEIVDLFFTEVAEVFARVKAKGATHSDMHFLKGSAANLGFVEFSKSCQIAEHALLAEDDTVDLQSVFDSFEASCAEFDQGRIRSSA